MGGCWFREGQSTMDGTGGFRGGSMGGGWYSRVGTMHGWGLGFTGGTRGEELCGRFTGGGGLGLNMWQPRRRGESTISRSGTKNLATVLRQLSYEGNCVPAVVSESKESVQVYSRHRIMANCVLLVSELQRCWL